VFGLDEVFYYILGLIAFCPYNINVFSVLTECGFYIL